MSLETIEKEKMATVIYPSPVFGPVKSRRLGRSLGVNLLPEDGKVCSFDCIYCECGFNEDFRPKSPLPSRELVRTELEKRLAAMKAAGEDLDALTFSGNGEPTSHPHFDEICEDVKALRDRYFPAAKVCLLTNATHLTKPRVFEAVTALDKACLKLDTVNPDYIRFVDRPGCPYDVATVIERMKACGGRCIIQTMFMKGTWQGQSVDNTTDDYVLPWVEAVTDIAPAGVDIYTVARDTPDKALRKASLEELERIAELLRARGISAHTYG